MQKIKKGGKKVKLGDICSYIGRGISPKYRDEGIVVINQRCIREGKIDFSNIRYSDNTKILMKEKELIGGEVLINSTGVGTLGRVSQIDKIFLKTTVDSHVTIVRLDNSIGFNYKYFGYLLKNNEKLIEKMGKGATGQTELSKQDLINFDIYITEDITTQQKIASILSKYDDLIENNNKRIKVLEEIAQSVYEEWFVNFNFPGSESVKKVDSGNDDFGMVPEGWEVKLVEDVTIITSKGPSLKYVENKKDGIPVVNQKCIRNNEIELNSVLYAERLKEIKEYCYLKKYDILINSMGTGTLGRVSRNLTLTDKYIIHNCISFLRADLNIIKQTLLYYQIKKKEDYFIALSTGSTGQTTLNIKEIKKVNIIVPDLIIQKRFDDIILSMFDEIGFLKKQNQNLKETRDLLIPRLVSGELDVESLDVK